MLLSYTTSALSGEDTSKWVFSMTSNTQKTCLVRNKLIHHEGKLSLISSVDRLKHSSQLPASRYKGNARLSVQRGIHVQHIINKVWQHPLAIHRCSNGVAIMLVQMARVYFYSGVNAQSSFSNTSILCIVHRPSSTDPSRWRR